MYYYPKYCGYIVLDTSRLSGYVAFPLCVYRSLRNKDRVVEIVLSADASAGETEAVKALEWFRL